MSNSAVIEPNQMGIPYEYPHNAKEETSSKLFKQCIERLRDSFTLGDKWRSSLADLNNLKVECSHPNWDGYNAPPLSSSVIERAKQFLNILPPDLPQPEIGASPQGNVTFAWEQAPRRIVAITISENAKIHYASLHNQRRDYGSLFFENQLDPEIYQLLCRVLN